MVGTDYTIGMSRALEDGMMESQCNTEERNKERNANVKTGTTEPDVEDKPEESEAQQTINALQ